jgi:hypothetical protein
MAEDPSANNHSQRLAELRYFLKTFGDQDTLIYEAIKADPNYVVHWAMRAGIKRLFQDFRGHFPSVALPYRETSDPIAMRSQIRLLRGRIEAITEREGQAATVIQEPHSARESDSLSVGEKIKNFVAECTGLTYEKLADLIDVEVRQVYRHLHEGVTPSRLTLTAYNRVFKERIGKTLVIPEKTVKDTKRQRKNTG